MVMGANHFATSSIFLGVILLCLLGTTVFSKPRSKIAVRDENLNDDSPLFLTSYVESGNVGEARRAGRVRAIPGMTRKSFSGFLTVRPEDDANLFFWYFPAAIDTRSAPVVLWLNGGPGTSALSGLFAENGPYYVTPDLELRPRPDNWATKFNMIYLDNPAGAGYSFIRSFDAYCNSSACIARDIHTALNQFFKIFSGYSSNDFYIAGQSYGGRFVVELANLIDAKNPSSDPQSRINLKGIVCLASFLSPALQIGHADFWYQTGLLDPDDYQEALRREADILDKLKNGQEGKGLKAAVDYILRGPGSFVFQSAAFGTGENVLESNAPPVFTDYVTFVKRNDIRRAIHVGNLTFTPFDGKVGAAINDALDKTPILTQILDKGYKVLMAIGNLDIYITFALYYELAIRLQWKHADAFNATRRVVWRVDPADRDFAGYVKCAENLCFSLVRNGGHRLTADQTRSTADLVWRFIRNLPFDA